MIRDVTKADTAALAKIYNYYIEETIISFEEIPISPSEMWLRVDADRSDHFPWVVFEEKDEVVGYASARKWHSRCAYKYSAELSVYLDRNVRMIHRSVFY